MAMYLGDKPVKAIKRSKNLLDLTKFTALIIKRIGNNLAKNEFADKKEVVDGVTFDRINGVSYFQVYGNATKAAGRGVFKTTIKKAGTYTLSVSNIPFNRLEISRGTVYMVALNKGGTMRHTFTLPNDNTEVSIVAVVATSDTIGTTEQPTTINVMLNEGDPLPYEPYKEWYEY